MEIDGLTDRIEIGTPLLCFALANDIGRRLSNNMVVKDDADALILFRFYNPKCLTEVISMDKKTGITIDTKTRMVSANLNPKTNTYLMNCQ